MRSNFRKFLLTFLSLIILGAQNFLSALEYEIIDLGTLETDRSEARCINDKGQVCGIYTFQGEQHFFLWDPKKGISCLDLPKGVNPIKMNNRGQIIGQFNVENTKLHAFFWDPATGFIDIGTLGGERTWVTDINDNGQVVGYSNTGTGQNERHAYLWENGVMTDLGTLCGDLCLHGTDSGAMGINNDGIIVGFSNYAIMHKGKKLMSAHKAVIWKNGNIQQLDIPNSEFYHYSQAYAVNNRMQVVYISEGKSYVKDLNKGSDFELHCSGLDRSKITDAGAILNQQWVTLGWTDNRTCPNPNIKNSIWKNAGPHNDVNNAGWVVGVATTIYGEEHAILLRPKN